MHKMIQYAPFRAFAFAALALSAPLLAHAQAVPEAASIAMPTPAVEPGAIPKGVTPEEFRQEIVDELLGKGAGYEKGQSLSPKAAEKGVNLAVRRAKLSRHLEQCFRLYWPDIATTGRVAPNAVQTVNFCNCVMIERRNDVVYDSVDACRPKLSIQ